MTITVCLELNEAIRYLAEVVAPLVRPELPQLPEPVARRLL